MFFGLVKVKTTETVENYKIWLTENVALDHETS